ncbi:MAG: zinc-ribbon domain containing protein [Muribaculaceae bacterium]|nr:zinc-ribbon domain containing protein [Alistipes senegalensis]MCM1473848.1 zinc-ribbon domain containing protein [Muribaculaceae bacterium]
MKIVCKQCHQEFELTDSDIKFFTSRNLNIPKRCKKCRDINKFRKNNSYEQSFSDSKSRLDSFLPSYKTMATIVVIVSVIVMVSIFFWVKSTESTSVRYIPPDRTVTYYLNTYRHKFHEINCNSVQEMNPKNKEAFYGTREEAIARGYEPCKNCKP